MRRLLRRLAAAGSLVLVPALVASCNGTDPVSEHQHAANPAFVAGVDGATAAEIARLRALVAPIRQLAAAQAAGFNAPITPCLASPDGGMGFHWGNPGRIDGTAKWDEPEVLVFAPSPDDADGVRLAAVEYIVPKALSPSAPVLFGQAFVPGGPGNSLWTMHVWIGIENPSGTFAPWNPRVSCPA